MKLLDKCFSKSAKNQESQDLMEIARIIQPLIDKTAREIFGLYQMKLLTEPITYIVPAVWGAKENGELAATQKEINEQVAPVIRKIFELLRLDKLSRAQEFAISFLIRGLIISKITYMIEKVKNNVADKTNSGKTSTDIIKSLEPLGTA